MRYMRGAPRYGPPKMAKPRRVLTQDYKRADAYGGEYEWGQTRTAILRRDNYTCQYRGCGLYSPPPKHGALHVHHVLPISRGGTNAHSNLITLCHPCHRKTHEELDRAHGKRVVYGNR